MKRIYKWIVAIALAILLPLPMICGLEDRVMQWVSKND
jgi:hypothetical protein